MKKNLISIGLMLLCVCAFALPRLLSDEPVGIKGLKEVATQAPDFENVKLHQLSDVKIADLASNRITNSPANAIRFPKPYTIYVKSELGWDSYALYAWGDEEMFGEWPGLVCTQTDTIDDVEYLVFPYEGLGETLHLIINNNGCGRQVEGIEITANRDYYLQVNADGWKEINNQVVSTDIMEYSEIVYGDYFHGILDGYTSGATINYFQDSVGDTYVDIFGAEVLAPKITFDEEGVAMLELGQLLYESSNYDYVLVEYDGDSRANITSGYVDLLNLPSCIGVCVFDRETGNKDGYYALYYDVVLFKPNVDISFSKDGEMYDIHAYAWQTENELWISHFAGTRNNGYCVKFDIDGDKLISDNQVALQSLTTNDGEDTGEFFLVGFDEQYYYLKLYATISSDRQSFTFDSDWSIYTANSYWYGRLSPATVNLQFAINNYSKPVDPGIGDIPERPAVVNNLLVNGDFEDPDYVQSDENVYNWLPYYISVNAESIPGWNIIGGGQWCGTVGIVEYTDEDINEDKGIGVGSNQHYCHYQFCKLNGWTYFGLEQRVDGLTPGKEYTLDMFVSHYFSVPEADVNYGIEIYAAPVVAGEDHGPEIANIRGFLDADDGEIGYFAHKFTAVNEGVVIRLLGYNYTYSGGDCGNAWVNWDEVRLYDANASQEYYLIGEKTDWQALDEYHFTLKEGSDHEYVLEGVTLAPEDSYYIADADETVIYHLAGNDKVYPQTLYSLSRSGGWQIQSADSIKDATLLVDFRNLEFMVRTDGKQTIDKPYTAMYDNSQTNWENVYAYWWNGKTGQECDIFPGKQMTLQGDAIYVIDFEQDWVPTNILFSDGGNGNQTADFIFVNGQTYDFNGKKPEWTVVNVPQPGELWSALDDMTGGYYGHVEYLKINGELNNSDLQDLLRNMPNLLVLDLGEAVLEEIPSNWSESSSHSLKKIILPPSVKTINAYAFSTCSNLEEVAFSGENNVKAIKDNAFYGCEALSAFDISNVEQIGNYAFYNCRSFKNFMASSAEEIGTYAFSESGIEVIPKGFFVPGMTYLADKMFMSCYNLRKIDLPSTIENLGYDVFKYCPIDTVICRAMTPPSEPIFGRNTTFSTYNALLVPMPAINVYQNKYPWSSFSDIKPILDEPIEYLEVGELLELYADVDLQTVMEGCDVNLTPYMDNGIGQLSFYGEAPLHLGDFIYRGIIVNRNMYWGSFMTSMIVGEECNVVSDSVSVTLDLARCGSSTVVWHFFSLPFDVKYDDITASEGTVWVIRKYDTEARAAGNMNATWVNLESGDVLKAGKGYIVSVYNGDYDAAVLTFPAASQGNAIFKASNAPVALDEIASDMPQNRSWNFVGNPYPAYFNLRDLLNQNGETFETPISLWRGYGYEAYCALDDDLYLRPFEAFFLQRPLNYSELIFANNGRMHYDEAKNGGTPGMYMPERITERGEREVFTFTVGIDSLTNRARIVINEKAEMGYEVGRDASKIFETSDNCPLLYVSADQSYAICERPLAEGSAVLGFTATKEGTYTLSLSGKHAQGWKVEITDKLTGVTTDLAETDYEFYAEAGEGSDRFLVKLTEPALTGIDAITTTVDANAATTVTNLAGIIVYSGAYGNMPQLPAGVYVITIDGTSHKVSVR